MKHQPFIVSGGISGRIYALRISVPPCWSASSLHSSGVCEVDESLLTKQPWPNYKFVITWGQDTHIYVVANLAESQKMHRPDAASTRALFEYFRDTKAFLLSQEGIRRKRSSRLLLMVVVLVIARRFSRLSCIHSNWTIAIDHVKNTAPVILACIPTNGR